MPYTRLKNFGLITAFSLTLPHAVFAQDAPINAPVEITVASTLKKSKIIRKVEPVPYWVNAEQLRIRDNPVAGDIIGIVELGQKVKAYEQFENWIRITKTSHNAKWLNINFLANTPITWARYGYNSPAGNQKRAGLRDDISLKRVKVKGDKSARIYATSVKQSANGNRVIVTRHNIKTGPYFEKRLVACADTSATHVQVLGEGYTYMTMENDARSSLIDINSAAPSLSISQAEPVTIAVANYSCETGI